MCGGRTRGADGVVYTVNFKRVARQAETPDAIALVTTYGPTLSGRAGRALRQRRRPGNAGTAAGTCNQANARVILVSFRGRPASAIACSIERNA